MTPDQRRQEQQRLTAALPKKAPQSAEASRMGQDSEKTELPIQRPAPGHLEGIATAKEEFE